LIDFVNALKPGDGWFRFGTTLTQHFDFGTIFQRCNLGFGCECWCKSSSIFGIIRIT
jgi:hypothetical protein